MSTFHIYFFGLISHIGDDAKAKRVAAMVRDEEHKPVVVFETDVHELKNIEAVHFGAASPAETTAAFRRFVPSLSSLLGGAPKQELKDSALLVHYPPTEDDVEVLPPKLTVGQLYPQQGIYRRGNTVLRPRECVARLVELTINSSATALSVFSVSKAGQVVQIGEIANNECVVIANIEQSGIDVLLQRVQAKGRVQAETGDEHPDTNTRLAAAPAVADVAVNPNHLNKYGSILDGDQPDVDIDELPNCPHVGTYSPECNWVTAAIEALEDAGVRVASHLECGNSAWP